MTRAAQLREAYGLEAHPEGGAFTEVYTAEFKREDGRPLSGSIYFLLEGNEVSHFHQIDCDELWYYHEGCGMKIEMLHPDGSHTCAYLGSDLSKGQKMMAEVPAGTVFAAENLDPQSYTFISCMTAPQFTYQTFRLVGKQEILTKWPEESVPEYLIDLSVQ